LPHYLERCAQGSFQTSGNRGYTRFLGNHASYYIRMLDRGNPEFKPIEKDEKNKERQYFCVGCGSMATQIAFFKIEAAVIIERYCDICASKLNQPASGI
jgi:hypothetical protein